MLAYYYTAEPVERMQRRADRSACATLALGVLAFVGAPAFFSLHGPVVYGFDLIAIGTAISLHRVVISALRRRREWAGVVAAAHHAQGILGLAVLGSDSRPDTSGHP